MGCVTVMVTPPPRGAHTDRLAHGDGGEEESQPQGLGGPGRGGGGVDVEEDGRGGGGEGAGDAQGGDVVDGGGGEAREAGLADADHDAGEEEPRVVGGHADAEGRQQPPWGGGRACLERNEGFVTRVGGIALMGLREGCGGSEENDRRAPMKFLAGARPAVPMAMSLVGATWLASTAKNGQKTM